MTPLHRSPYSYEFLILGYMGGWVHHPYGKGRESSFKVNAYALYRLLMTGVFLYTMYCLFLNLLTVMGDMEKMTWNMGITILFLGTGFKNVEMLRQREKINTLRMMLHRDAESRRISEDIVINEMAQKEMKRIRLVFYISCTFMPLWIVYRYMARELPIPMALPDFVDVDNTVHFHVAFFCMVCLGAYVILFTDQLELGTYGLLVQILREFRILLKDIHKINLLYLEDDDDDLYYVRNTINQTLHLRRTEVNPVLRKIKTKMVLKRLCKRQATLISYIEAFELSFSKIYLHYFYASAAVIVILGLLILGEPLNLSGYLVYQISYMYITIVNMFLMCWWPTVIRTHFLGVGEAFYSTLWYRMDTELQRDIAMIIMRSQRPPKFTAGKLIELSLNSFMDTMGHTYSWLAFFRQLE